MGLLIYISRSVTMGLLVGFLYYGVENSQVSVQDRTGALYFVLTTQVHKKKTPWHIKKKTAKYRSKTAQEHSILC